MMTTVKRQPLKTALALTAALALAGCSSGVGSDTAVTVDGTDYSVAQLQQATTDLNDAGASVAAQGGAADVGDLALSREGSTPQQVVADLALLPLLEDVFAGSPAETNDAAVRQALSRHGVNDPGQGTVDAALSRTYQALLSDSATFADPAMGEVLTRAQSVTIADMDALGIEVNPRYGHWDSANGGLAPFTPDWIQADGEDS